MTDTRSLIPAERIAELEVQVGAMYRRVIALEKELKTVTEERDAFKAEAARLSGWRYVVARLATRLNARSQS